MSPSEDMDQSKHVLIFFEGRKEGETRSETTSKRDVESQGKSGR